MEAREAPAGPEDVSPPRKLLTWLRHQHPQHRIVYIDGGNCASFNLFPYLRSIQAFTSAELESVQNPGLVELYWGDSSRPSDDDGIVSNLVDHSTYEHMLLMGGSHTRGLLKEKLVNGFVDVHFEGTPLRAYTFEWMKGFSSRTANFLVWQGESDNLGRKLVEEVFRWEKSLRNEAWMFDMRWIKSHELYHSIQSARPEDIVLPDGILTSLTEDVESFFASQEEYRTLGVAWKRGILLVGPPGNGKTETIKAIVKQQSRQPLLYVKSFQTGRRSTPEQGIRAIFEKARLSSPCILVMEDLDSLVSDETKSFVLNEIDGLESNDGILIIATSNHPEKLDNAFSKRPSRFDTKYHFANPSRTERKRFIDKWMDQRLAQVNFGSEDEKEDLISALVEGSHDWSYAFLKEIFISFALVSASSRRKKRSLQSSPSMLLLDVLGQLQSHISDSEVGSKDK